MKLDTEESGLRKVFKVYEIVGLEYLFSVEEPVGSGKVWAWINAGSEWGQTPGNSISRASVINFLNRLVNEDLLTWKDATGKGGHHRLYKMVLSRQEFVKKVIEKFITALKEIADLENIEYSSSPFLSLGLEQVIG